jgi:hypothetical protein
VSTYWSFRARNQRNGDRSEPWSKNISPPSQYSDLMIRKYRHQCYPALPITLSMKGFRTWSDTIFQRSSWGWNWVVFQFATIFITETVILVYILSAFHHHQRIAMRLTLFDRYVLMNSIGLFFCSSQRLANDAPAEWYFSTNSGKKFLGCARYAVIIVFWGYTMLQYPRAYRYHYRLVS